MKNYAIHLKRTRDKLGARNEPYWQQVPSHKGLSMGYRKSDKTGLETWHCRLLSGGKHQFKSLGPVASLSYEEAGQQALEWVKGPRSSAEAPSTVAETAARYVEVIKSGKGKEPATEARQRTQRIIARDPIGAIKLKDLLADDIEAWLRRQSEGRDGDSANRDYRVLRAVLNLAFKRKWITTNSAWKHPDGTLVISQVRGKPRSKRQRARVLSPDEQRQLIAACDDDLAPLVKALFMTGCRPIELRRATVADLRNNKIRAYSYKGKDGEPRERWFPLTETQKEFLEELAIGKEANDLLFLRADGTSWPKEAFNKKFREARIRAKLKDPDKVQPYSARRSLITRFISNNVDLAQCEKLFGSDTKNLSQDYHDAMPTSEELERLAVDL